MTPAALLAHARDLGLRVAEEGGGLRLEGAALTDELVAEIRAAKTELLTLLRDEAAGAIEAEAREHSVSGPAWAQLGLWWVNPESGPQDLAILRAIDRLDRQESRKTSPEKAQSTCYGCGGRDRWRARDGGHLVCRTCHPPVPGAEVAQVLATDSAAGARESA